jgi:hypothetical protein
MTNNDSKQDVVHSEVSRVAIKIPPMWKNNVELWFTSIESQFVVSGISNELTKFHYIVSSLDSETLVLVAEIVRTKVTELETPYTTLKERIIAQYESSESARLRALISDLLLGDKKPSHLLYEMQELAAGKIQDSILQTLWLQKLPVSMQQILSASTDKLEGLAKTADKVAEVSHTFPENVCAIESENARISKLEVKIDDLTRTINELQRKLTLNKPKAGQHRERSKSRDRTKVCWYHFKFREKANKCIPPCSFSGN